MPIVTPPTKPTAPTVPDRNNRSRFPLQMETFHSFMAGDLVDYVSDAADCLEANAEHGAASATEAESQAGIATTQAGVATTQAEEATTQAGIATTQAEEATTQAGIAATKAGIATAKASESSASAVAAAAFAGDCADLVAGLADGPVASVNGRGGVVVLDPAGLGLGNVDNTSDESKPISTATQAALNSKVGATDTQTLTNKTLSAATNTVEATSGPSGSAFSFRNKIINGGFGINQRGYASGAATTAGRYTLDRWKVTGTGGVTFSATNNKTTVTIPSGQTFQQVIEGLNLQTGTYVLSWEGTARGRIAGGSYGASGIAASITGGTNTTIEFNAGTVANVQLEAGSVATPFETRPYGVELALCQRYYEKSYQPDVAPGTVTTTGRLLITGSTNGAEYMDHPIRFCVTKRATPTTITFYNAASGASGQWQYEKSGGGGNNLPGVGASGSAGFSVAAAVGVGVWGLGRMYGHWTAEAEL